MKIDERALGAAQGKAADCGWMFTTGQHRKDLEAIIGAYLSALPSAEPGRDRIAVSRFKDGDSVCEWLVEGEEPDWIKIESVIDLEKGQAARYIVRANCPPPAELVPVEVEGSVEGGWGRDKDRQRRFWHGASAS